MIVEHFNDEPIILHFTGFWSGLLITCAVLGAMVLITGAVRLVGALYKWLTDEVNFGQVL